MNYKHILIITLTLFLGFLASGCELMPVTRYKPTLHNPFPEMRTVAVLPFFNQTGNGSFDGREFAKCFANELQRIPGFHVVANDTVEKTMLEHEILRFDNVDDIRYLAQLLKADAIVVGKVHDFKGYYAPHIKFETEWYSVNPYLHPMPPGYGLPWGTEHENFIPPKLALLAEMELAAAQIKTQTPDYEPVLSPAERKKQLEPPEEKTLEADQYEFRWQPSEANRNSQAENPIRLAAATIPNTLGRESLNESELGDYAEYRQDQALNDLLKTTGTPYIPEGQPRSEEDQKKEAITPDPEMPHPLQNGPWPSQTAQQGGNPWSAQSQFPLYQQGQYNWMYPGAYQGHYPAQNFGVVPTPEQIEALTAHLTEEQLAALTPEQLAQMTAQLGAQHGWTNQQVSPLTPQYPFMPGMPVEGQAGLVMGEPDSFPGLPKDWPDPRGFIPEGPKPEKPKEKIRNDGPILSHISFYEGNESEFMQALQDYDFLFRDDKRIAGNQSILMNRSEFIRFCCRLHIWEIFTARGGAGQAEKVVRQWKIWEGGEK